MKYDDEKPQIALIPPECMVEISKVFGMGAKKYGAWNWREDVDTTSFSRTYSSIQRHLFAFWAGEDIDPESGLSHLAHAATQIIILMTHYEEGSDDNQMDDRWIDSNV